MTSRIMVCVIVLLTIIIGLGLYQKINEPPMPEIIQFDPIQLNELSLSEVEESPESCPVPEEILAFNEINRAIKGVSCSGINVYVWEGGFRFKLKGLLRYEKDKKFRMTVHSFFGRELDLGSNENQFWFWSRRSDEPGLFYAKHEDYYKTRLKTPFNPLWIMHTLGVDPIAIDGAKILDEPGEDILIAKEGRNSLGKTVLTTTVVDRNSLRIKSIVMTDLNGKPLASSEIKEYSGKFPTRIVYNWFEEDKIMEIRINGPWEGGNAKPELWKMPNINPKTDMGID